MRSVNFNIQNLTLHHDITSQTLQVQYDYYNYNGTNVQCKHTELFY